jgi:hypothetical protein
MLTAVAALITALGVVGILGPKSTDVQPTVTPSPSNPSFFTAGPPPNSTPSPTKQLLGPPNIKVWVNTKSGIYHCARSKDYGRTGDGVYMTQAQAQLDGKRPARGKVCQS